MAKRYAPERGQEVVLYPHQSLALRCPVWVSPPCSHSLVHDARLLLLDTALEQNKKQKHGRDALNKIPAHPLPAPPEETQQ